MKRCLAHSPRRPQREQFRRIDGDQSVRFVEIHSDREDALGVGRVDGYGHTSDEPTAPLYHVDAVDEFGALEKATKCIGN
ncbi:MAG: hypothetical protein C4337_04950, partial [Armatimonadota bacterium]